MRKILVTGGAGYIGSHLVRHLMSRGVEAENIVILDNLSQGHVDYVPLGVGLEICDLKNFTKLSQVFKRHEISEVIHLAGSAYVGESMINPMMYFENNVAASINLIKCCEKFNCKKFIFSSSCAVYGNQIGESICEEHELNPINPYGESKLMVENILGWLAHTGKIKVISLRYFNVGGAGYGLRERHDPETHIIPIVLQEAKAGRSIKIYGDDYPTSDGSCERDFVHVVDLAEAHFLALKYIEEMQTKKEIFNLGGNNPISILDLIKMAESLMDIKISYQFSQRRSGDPASLVAKSNKAREVLGWSPKFGLKEILQTTIDSIV